MDMVFRTRLRLGAGVVVMLGWLWGQAPALARDPFAKWLSDAPGFGRAIEQRRGTSDTLLLYFYVDWCPYCRALNTNVMGSTEVDRYLDHVLAVRINPEHGPQEEALAKTYGVTGYPTVLVLPARSDRAQQVAAYRQQGATWNRMTAAEFVAACQRASHPSHGRFASPRRPASPPRASTTPIASSAPSPVTRAPYAPEHPVTLHLKNGETIDGDLVRETPDDVTLRLEYGDVVFQRAEIESVVDATSASE